MANGSQCCALEICCPPAERRIKITAALVKFTGADAEYCEKFLDWMDHESLVFAPIAFQSVIDNIVKLARRHPADA